ncbi:Pancreatic lipase-related protein 2 [Mactra antiquata]
MKHLAGYLSFTFLAISVVNGFLSDKVCYNDVGCFSSDAPFNNAMDELPDSPEEIQTQAYLWTKQNPVTPQIISYSNISTIRQSNFDSSRPTKVLVHGYMSSKDASPVVANLSVALLKMDDYNVIGIDWHKGARQFYPKAVANTRVVAAVVVKLLTGLRDNMGMKLSDLHLIGHSLGAHTVGYIGASLPGTARVTGLDPAGPMFSTTPPIVRLDPTDALFVDVIHSDAAPLDDAGFGTTVPMGHVDFYPNGGQVQPGCPPPVKTTLEELAFFQFSEAFDSVSCAHDRAIWYFIESVQNTLCQFTARQCQSWEQFKADDCNTVTSVMGFNSIKYNGEGKFYLATNAQAPFCHISNKSLLE